MNKLFSTLIALAVGVTIGVVAMGLVIGKDESDAVSASARKPLYWVAPMDANYRRDQPGKSPMGMDLVPVYEESNSGAEVGTVSISPQVVNNLGVRTAEVKRGRLDVTVNTVGYVQYDEDRLIHIHPRVEGWIETLHAKAAGDPVKQGEPLYALYSPTLVNAQEEFLLAQKRNNPTLVAAAMERMAALQIPDSEIRRLKQSGTVSQTITFRAPQSGVLDNLDTREGMFVKPGMEMMTIGQLEHIWVIGEVFERQAMSVHEGDPVSMYLDYLPGREWRGSVDYIYPSLNTRTRTARVRVHFDNTDGYLRPGMFAQMAITTRPAEETLLVPREALIRTGGQARVVLAKGDGRFKSIAVQVGRIGEHDVEILSGLREGERIVSSAQFLIDSESSKTSDFKRMDAAESDPITGDAMAMPGTGNNATVRGLINHVDSENRVVNISREAIKKWNRPAATMDFNVSPELDLQRWSGGEEVVFSFEVAGGVFTITDIQPVTETSTEDSSGREHSHD